MLKSQTGRRITLVGCQTGGNGATSYAGVAGSRAERWTWLVPDVMMAPVGEGEMPQAVFFDFGDTLFRRASGAGAIVEIGAARDCPIDPGAATALWESIHERARSPEEITLARDLSPEAHRREWTRLFSAADVLLPGMGRALYERETDPEKWIPYPDAEGCLERLKERGLSIAVVSDTGWDIRAVFARRGFDRFIDAWVLSYEHGAVKPAPALFRAACEALGVEPRQALMVGDNPATDGGAVAAAVPTLILPPVEPGAPRGLGWVERICSGA